ncbi:aspartate ammonia-lyase [Priestia megaterium]|uniref:aspartate ammonia-lyase n=1 Tax=Priestia megaterium TaxID=1404 RepID=UPI000BF3108E|nr:aspartate ammonia-lyase [Priestia megaterium]AUO14663.1 aspartate ammonia-lyase [Priestia megaterium]PFJ96580.1 aspartate ammonia-lyase [Priestia megaterium]
MVLDVDKNIKFRIEKDFLGTKEVPHNVYYGIQTLRAVENFPITGYKVHTELIKALAMIKKAAAISNTHTQRMPLEIGKAISDAAQEVIDGKLHDQFIVDPIQGGAGTSMNMNINEVVANRALELLGVDKGTYSKVSPNSHVNMSQSTNDVFPTAIHISILKLSEGLITTIEHMKRVFKQKAQEFDHVIKMGRTHLQDAVPIRLGQEFEAYSRVLERDLQRIKQSRQHLYEVNMGATAVGTGLNADPNYTKNVVKELKNISDLPLEHASHLVDATQNTDAYTEISSTLKVCMINMSKICNDLRLMSSGPRAGLAEISLPARQPGSSIMPGKVNPVMAEMINQVAFQVVGNDHTICMASEAGQLELNVMEPVLIFNLLQSISIMKNAFQAFTNYCLKDIQANENHLTKFVERSVGVITAVNPHIGYEMAASIAREATLSETPVKDLCLQKGVLTEEQLNIILDPFEMTRPGIAGKQLLNTILS